jgi:uncharacterized protein (DUF305 family)
MMLAATAILAWPAAAQDVPIVQPGAPGQPSRVIDADTATEIANTRFSPADIRFIRHMIHHHAQAVEMAALIAERTQHDGIMDIGERISATQADEIEFMNQWLTERGEPAEDPAAHHGHDMSAMMPGMLTRQQMDSLAAARGEAFDRLFLEGMIEHHEGAIDMVEALLETPGSAHDPVLYDFANDVVNDQRAEITQMNVLLAELATDPRANLTPGLTDAGEAALHLELVASLSKPVGFFDPANPAGLRLPLAVADSNGQSDEGGKEVKNRFASRGPMLTFGNTDMAFRDDVLVVGNYHGFNIYRLGDAGVPSLVSSVVCPGGQGDVSIVDDTLIMSVEQTLGRIDCGTQGVESDVSAERMRGLRLFDISNLSAPRQVGIVQTCRGSHTHSVVTLPDADDRILVYNSGTSSIRDEEELPGCIGNVAGDERTALFSIDVIEVPLDEPASARIVASPRIFADADGNIAGLWRGGDHGEGTQETRPTDQCHDITVFPTLQLAAGACSGNGILLDISDPAAPRRVDAVTDTGFAYWHSATLNNDGTKVLFTDEWGGGVQARCQASDPASWGANAIYDIVSNRLERRGTFKLPAPQGEMENCVAHNGSIVPVPGRDIMVQAWYQGGLSVLDFTDSSNPFEIAYFDRGPIDADQRVVGGYWSAYFHDGAIYASEIVRGLDVLRLTPSEHLTANEIAAAALAIGEPAFNPQRQTPVRWPAVPVVGHAYLDQLSRGGVVAGPMLAGMRNALERAETTLQQAGASDRPLAVLLDENAAYARNLAADGRDRDRLLALAALFEELAARSR